MCQKRRFYYAKQNTALVEEVDKLLKASFIREVEYPRSVANLVMVRKSANKWRK